MVPNKHLLTLQLSQAALRSHGEHELANALQKLITADLTARAAVSTAAKARGTAANRAVNCTVTLEPGWQAKASGAAQAHELLKEALTQLGSPQLLPKRTSFAAMLSRDGGWWRNVETDNGTVTVSITRDVGTVPA